MKLLVEIVARLNCWFDVFGDKVTDRVYEIKKEEHDGKQYGSSEDMPFL